MENRRNLLKYNWKFDFKTVKTNGIIFDVEFRIKFTTTRISGISLDSN